MDVDKVRRYQFDTTIQPVSLTIQFADKDTPVTYTWHSDSGRFVIEADLAASQRQSAKTEQTNRLLMALETWLFDFVNPVKKQGLPEPMLAVAELAEVDSYLTKGIPPSYLAYLFGLAYELNGDEEQAIQAYWQLWHDYPDSPYTLLARRKLERVGP